MNSHKNLLATCSLLAVLALAPAAAAADGIIIQGQTLPAGYTIAAGVVVTPGVLTPQVAQQVGFYLGSSTVTGAVSNAGIIMSITSANTGATTFADGLYINQSSVTQGLTNSGVITAQYSALALAKNASPRVYGVRLQPVTAFGGVVNTGSIGGSVVEQGNISAGNDTNSVVQGLQMYVGNTGAPGFTGGLTNAGLITATLQSTLTIAGSTAGGYAGAQARITGLEVDVLGGGALFGAGILGGGITNSGAILATGTIAAAVSGAQASFNTNLYGVRVNARAGFGTAQSPAAGGDFSGTVTNSGTILASLSESGNRASQTNDRVDGISIVAYGSFGPQSLGSTVTAPVINSGTILARATITAAQVSSRVDGIYLNARGGNGGGFGGTFNGGVTNSGLVSASITATPPALAAGAAATYNPVPVQATGLYVGAGGGNAYKGLAGGGGSVQNATLVNSGTIVASVAANGNVDARAYGVTIAVRSGGGSAMAAGSGGTFTGSITNSGTILASGTASGNRAISTNGRIDGITITSGAGNGARSAGGTVTAPVINSGTLLASATITAAQVSSRVDGIYLNAQGGFGGGFGGIFMGGVTNSGLVSASVTSTPPALAAGAAATYNPVSVQATGFFVNAGGGNVNKGQAGTGGSFHNASLVNSGTIEASVRTSGPVNAQAFGLYIRLGGGSATAMAAGSGGTFIGNITNTGTILAAATGPGSGGRYATGLFIGVFASGNHATAGTFIGDITNTGTIIGTTNAIDLSTDRDPTVIHQNAGLLQGSLLGAGKAAGQALLFSGGTIQLSPTQTISGFGTFTQSGGTLVLQVGPGAAPLIQDNTIALKGTLRVVPVTGLGPFAASTTFQNVINANHPIDFSGETVINTVPELFTVNFAPDPLQPSALDLHLDLTPAARTLDLTQNLRFALEAPEVLRDSIGHRLLEGSSYDGGGIAAASLSDGGRSIAGGPGLAGGEGEGALGLWGRAYGVAGSADSSDGSSSFDTRRVGFILGGDWRLGEHSVAGLALDYDHTDATFADATHSHLDAYQAAAYLGWKDGPWYLNGLLGAGFDDFSTSRSLSGFGLPGLATSKPVGETYFLYGEAGYRFTVNNYHLTPYLGEGLTHAQIHGFTENGGFGALTVQPGSSDSFATTFGFRASSEVRIGESVTLIPELRLGYQVEFLDAAQSLDASLANVPFTATGANYGRSTALVGVGVTSNLNARTRVFLDYDGRITGGLQEHAVSAGLLVKF